MSEAPNYTYSVGLRRKKVSFPKPVKLEVYSDHLLITPKKGDTQPLVLPFASIERAEGGKSGMIALYAKDGEFYHFQFFSTWSTMFGLLGVLLLSKGRKRGEECALALQQAGVAIKLRTF